MIKFFRRIRQNLLAENRLGKYLIYAIGEIILVVVGILIALQINNWNIERIKNIREKELVKFIYDELGANAGYIELRIDEFEKRLLNARKLLSLTGSEAKTIHPDSLGKYTAAVFIMGTYSPYKMNLTRIIHSEEFNLIRHDSLQTLLGEYEIILDRSIQLYEAVSSMKSHWELIDHQVLTVESFGQASMNYEFNYFDQVADLSFDVDTRDILANPKFAAILGHEISTFGFFIKRTYKLKEDIAHLRDFIEKHYELD